MTCHTRSYTTWNATSSALEQHTQPHTYRSFPSVHPWPITLDLIPPGMPCSVHWCSTPSPTHTAHFQFYPPLPCSIVSTSISALSCSTSIRNSLLSKIQFWHKNTVLAAVELPVIKKLLLSMFVFSMYDYSWMEKSLGMLMLTSAINEYKLPHLCKFI